MNDSGRILTRANLDALMAEKGLWKLSPRELAAVTALVYDVATIAWNEGCLEGVQHMGEFEDNPYKDEPT